MSFVSLSLNNGGVLRRIIPPNEYVKGTGTFNPSIIVDGDSILLSFRNSNYVLYYSEHYKYSLEGRYIDYVKPEDTNLVETCNYICHLDKDLFVSKCSKVDTSKFDIPSQWIYSGLEDPRLVKWENKFYLVGVRRDDNPNGSGRIEASELEFCDDGSIVEKSRSKLPAPYPDNSYCEKNWMPILNKPYNFVKWTNSTEIVECDFDNRTTNQVLLKDQNSLLPQIYRGGSQVIPWDDGYLCITHSVQYFELDKSSSMSYKQNFIYWDKDWNIVKYSDPFTMMDGGIEFVSGMAVIDNDFLISFGFQDCLSFVLRVPQETVSNLLKYV